MELLTNADYYPDEPRALPVEDEAFHGFGFGQVVRLRRIVDRGFRKFCFDRGGSLPVEGPRFSRFHFKCN